MVEGSLAKAAGGLREARDEGSLARPEVVELNDIEEGSLCRGILAAFAVP